MLSVQAQVFNDFELTKSNVRNWGEFLDKMFIFVRDLWQLLSNATSRGRTDSHTQGTSCAFGCDFIQQKLMLQGCRVGSK
jgi:hypothetical protein